MSSYACQRQSLPRMARMGAGCLQDAGMRGTKLRSSGTTAVWAGIPSRGVCVPCYTFAAPPAAEILEFGKAEGARFAHGLAKYSRRWVTSFFVAASASHSAMLFGSWMPTTCSQNPPDVPSLSSPLLRMK